MISWLKRKKSALCALAGVLSVSLFVIGNSSEKIKEDKGVSYAVKIRHYGIDAAEMERGVTIPLEDALFAIPNVISVASSSENSLSSVFVMFRPGGKGRYEAARDAAQRVYETLPPSAQRPEILSSNNSNVPVWSAAVSADNPKEIDLAARALEKILKPRLESLAGAGEVIVSGVGVKQILIALDQEKLTLLKLEPMAVAAALGNNDMIFSGGSLVQGNREIIVTVDGRYDFGSLNEALIPLGGGKFIQLREIAFVTEQERAPDILSRLNGKKTASIAVMRRHDTDPRGLSSDIKRTLSSLSEPLEIIVLSDLGAEEAAAFRSVLSAALLGAIMTAVISFFLNRRNAFFIAGFFSAIAIPLICLVSAAILSIRGLPIDRLTLAGIAAGVGTAVDSVILCSEKLSGVKSYSAASKSLLELVGPLTAGAATTAAALIPLFAVEDARVIALAIAVITVAAFAISLTLLPPLLLWNINAAKEKKISKRTPGARRLYRFLAACVNLSSRHPAAVSAACLALAVSAIFALLAKGADTSGFGSENSVCARIEFDGGLLAEEVDRLLASYSEKLARGAGIKNVETGARTGSGSLLVSFDPKRIGAQAVRDLAKEIPVPGGFVFFHESEAKDRYWEIKIHGDENKKCEELAECLARLCAGHPLVKMRVLNFKQGSKKLILAPDRELLAETGISFSAAAARARQGVYGPVAYKRINEEGETDVRILTTGKFIPREPDSRYAREEFPRASREDALGVLAYASRENSFNAIPIESLTRAREDTEPSSLRRDNRRVSASITISTKPMDPRRVKRELSPLFGELDLPAGYSVEFDPEAVKKAEDLSKTFLSLLMAVIFCYMIIASINESFTLPLIVIAAIPPSLSIPALFLVLSGGAYNPAVACAFIAVSGMTVNAAVLCVDGLRRLKGSGISIYGIYLAIRKKIPALLSTTGTTIAAAIPFLFLGEGANALIRTISLVGALGVAGSLVFSITLIPALFILIKTPRLSGKNPDLGARHEK